MNYEEKDEFNHLHGKLNAQPWIHFQDKNCFCCSYVVELMRMLWEPALSLSLLQLMKCFQMTPHCSPLVFALFHWIQNQLSFSPESLSLVVLTILSIWLTADVRITHVQADNKSISTSHFQKFVESIILVCCTQFKCFDRRYMPYSGIQVSLKVRLFNEYYRIKNPWQTSNMCNRQNSSLTLVVGHCDFYLLVAK